VNTNIGRLHSSVRAIVCWVGAVLFYLGAAAQGADWPAYGADAARSGRNDETLNFPLEAAWAYTPAQPPRPAWPEPGKELHRLDFDYAPQPVAASGLVYFASSADDTVRALYLETGEVRWHFTAGGPIRFAPAIAEGKAYVASDDGWLYALDAATGMLLWRFHGAPRDDQMLGNGRMISRWPIRTGPAVADGVVYFAAGMWPADGIYVYAVDARSGARIWCNDTSASMYRNQPHQGSSAFTGVCPQGYVLIAGDRLLVPSGRTTPAAFDRKTGKLLYYQPYLYSVPYTPEGWGNRANGGWWMTLAGDSFVCGMHKGGAPEIDAHVGETEPRAGDGVVFYSLATGLRELSLPDRYCAVVSGDTLYAAGKSELQAIDMKAWREKKMLDERTPKAVAETAQAIATREKKMLDSSILWRAESPRPYCLALAGGTLLAGGRGTIRAFDSAAGKQLWSAPHPTLSPEGRGQGEGDAQVRGLAVAGGRIIAATNKGGIICYGPRGNSAPQNSVRDAPPHPVMVSAASQHTAISVVRNTGVKDGYALVVGEPNSRLAEALAQFSLLHVICMLPPESDLGAERQRTLYTSLYGSRIAVQKLDGSGRLPFAPYFADLVVVTGDGGHLSGEELYRVLRPCGGVMCFPGLTREESDNLIANISDPLAKVRSSDGLRLLTRGRLPGAGEWRSQWADGGNTGIGEESLVRPPLDILWFGGPGPDRMMARHLEASAPLSVNGRVFVAGQHSVIAFNAYNGRELWCQELHGVGRSYALWNGSNFVADDTSLYAAAGAECHRLDQGTGQTIAVHRLPGEEKSAPTVSETASVEVAWPAAWKLFGPLPKDTPVLPETILKAIPDVLQVEAKTYQPLTARPVKGKIDLTHFYGGYGFKPLGPDEKPEDHPRESEEWDDASEESQAYLFAEIECPAAGYMTIGAGADWWMQWFLDGKPFFDTLENGNEEGEYSATNHVFSATVTKGRHVLAVMCKAGGRGWCLYSAGGARNGRNAKPLPPNHLKPRWGYLSVAGDLILGSYVPGGARQSVTEASALFALDKKDGSLRWQYRPTKSLLNMSIAWGDGRVFVLDGTAPSLLFKAKQTAQGDKGEMTLLALDLKTGAELWRQDDVPSAAEKGLHRTLRFVQYSRHVVELGANAAYDAATGMKLWHRKVNPARLPLIRDGWIIAEPQAYNLKTGEPRMVTDSLTGQQRPWKFTRAYGCGPIAGCQDMLFFRSGVAGFYDFETEGTSTFSGVRPGCSITMVPANGLMILPEGSSSCSCSYNFQTSLALIPARNLAHASAGRWQVLAGEELEAAPRSLSLNFGAPGDRRDSDGRAWLAFPRPDVKGASFVPLRILEGEPEYCCRAVEQTGTDKSWLYSSGVRGTFRMALDLARAPVVVSTCEEPPKLDGLLDDACWKDATAVPFEAEAHLLPPRATLFIRRDAENLYFAFRREAALRRGKPVPFAAKHSNKNDKNAGQDDSVVFGVSDGQRQVALSFVLSCAGGSFQKVNHKSGQAMIGGPPWNGEWRWAAKKDEQAWAAEAAIPLKTLQSEGLDPARLQVNCTPRDTSGQGPVAVALTAASSPPLGAFVPIVQKRVSVPERKYMVRLHFAETGANVEARPPFDVELQGKLVLNGRALQSEATGHAVVKEFTGVLASEKMTICLIPGSATEAKTKLCLCRMEVLAEE